MAHTTRSAGAQGRLRIVSGAARGRILSVPRGRKVRPTPDRVREALFSILGQRCLEARVLDPCAGTGALGLEALSRGASEVLFIERDRLVAETVAENIERVDLAGARLERGDARSVIARLAREDEPPFDLVLVDPPYKLQVASSIAELVVEKGLLAPDGLVVLEHPSQEPMEDQLAGLRLVDQRQYGSVALSLYESE